MIFSEKIQVSISLGVAMSSNESTVEEFLEKANNTLYRAKENGRSQLEVYA